MSNVADQRVKLCARPVADGGLTSGSAAFSHPFSAPKVAVIYEDCSSWACPIADVPVNRSGNGNVRLPTVV